MPNSNKLGKHAIKFLGSSIFKFLHVSNTHLLDIANTEGRHYLVMGRNRHRVYPLKINLFS